MTDHSILIFAYHYPPENAVGAARPFRFSKYLSRLGYTCRVFTAAEQTGLDDPNTEYVPDPFVTQSRRSAGWQFERAIRKVLWPGAVGTQWSYHASRAARAYIRAHPSARVTLFSTYPPLGAHLAAWQVARSTGVPWIADFRDAIPDAPVDKGSHQFQTRVCRWLEVMTARRTSAVIANTDAAMFQWRKRFPSQKEKCQLIWNGFDPEERIAPLPASSGDRRVLSHTGELYDGRIATPILESIARLIATGRLSSGTIRVRLIGPAEAETLPSQDFLDRARAAGWLELVTERIPQREALQIARSSDALLLIQLRSAVPVPAKIFEYVQIGRPILAFIQRNSPSERLLERSGVSYRCVYSDASTCAIDETVAEFFSLPSTAVAVSPWFEEQFNAENQTRQLDAIIRSVHNQQVRNASSSPELPICAEDAAFKQHLNDSEPISNPALDSVDRPVNPAEIL